MRKLIAGALLTAVACLPEIDDPFPTHGGVGGTLASTCEGPCCPSDPVCYPDGDPLAPGGECLATRDNRGKDRVQVRVAWTRTLLPEAGMVDITYQFFLDKTTLPLAQCNQNGVSGYILLYDWDRSSPDITEHTVRSGYAVAFEDGLAEIQEGLCFMDMMYSDPENGWTVPVHIKPAFARRVAEDFDVNDPAFQAQYRGQEEGVFHFDEETNTQHGYASKAFVVIYESKDNIFVLRAHDVETSGKFNDEALNCQGTFRGDALDPTKDCKSPGQLDPPYTCEDCELGMGPSTTSGHFLIEELEETKITLLNSTLCVQYMGQQFAIDEGWANPSGWGLNCSGSPKWQAGERPRGDWCHATNAPATDDCHDAFRSVVTAAGAAVNIREGTCSDDVQ